MASTRSERAPLLGGDSASILAAVAAEEGRVDAPRGGGRPDDDESSGRRRRRLGGVAATIATTACLALLGRGGFPGTLPGSSPAPLVALGDATDGGAWGYANGAALASSSRPRRAAAPAVDWTAVERATLLPPPRAGGSADDAPATFAHRAGPDDVPAWVAALAGGGFAPRGGAPNDARAASRPDDRPDPRDDETSPTVDAAPSDTAVFFRDDRRDPESSFDWPPYGSEGEARASAAVRRLERREKRLVSNERRRSGDDRPSSSSTLGAPRAFVRERRPTAPSFERGGERDPAAGSVVGASLFGATRTTFEVNVCGVPPVMRANQAPWPACRVLLLGCPGEGSGSLGRRIEASDPEARAREEEEALSRSERAAAALGGGGATGAARTTPRRRATGCETWDVSRAIEMTPDATMGVFSTTTDLYGPGDEFAFALVKPGCESDADIYAAIRRAESRAGDEDDSSERDAEYERLEAKCSVRLDSGFPMGNHVRAPGKRDVRCWSPRASEEGEEAARLGLGDAVCRSDLRHGAGPWSVDSDSDSDASESSACVLRRERSDAPGTYRRVVPAREDSSSSDERVPGAASKKSSGGSRVSFVWGTCDERPRHAGWCEAPAFDAAKVAGACGGGAFEGGDGASADGFFAGADAPARGGGGPGAASKTRRGAKKSSKASSESSLGGASDDDASDDASGPPHKRSRAEVAASSAAALKSKTEPLLDDSAATRAEAAFAEALAESEGRAKALAAAGAGEAGEDDEEDASLSSSSSSSSSASSSGSSALEALEAMMPEVDDFFELETDEGEDAASYLDPGAWARTPAKPVRLGGAPRAVLHLVLRDGDAMFASERQPWAEVTVNGRAVKPPVRVREDDEVALGVRAPTEAEIEAQEEDAASDLGGRGRFGGSLEEGFATTREATVVFGKTRGTLRVRVKNRGRFAIGGGGAGAEDPRGGPPGVSSSTEKEEEAAAKDPAGGAEKSPAAVATEVGVSDKKSEEALSDKEGADAALSDDHSSDAESSASSSADPMRLGDAETLGDVSSEGDNVFSPLSRVTAPAPGQWMVIPPVDRDPIVISGLGDGVARAVTVRFFADEAEALAEERRSDGREPPRGDANGVFAKINGRDLAVKSPVVQVWTREEMMEVRRLVTAEQRRVEVRDGDRVRLRVRAPKNAGEPPRALAVFVGERDIGRVSVDAAGDDRAARRASDDLEAQLRRARERTLGGVSGTGEGGRRIARNAV